MSSLPFNALSRYFASLHQMSHARLRSLRSPVTVVLTSKMFHPSKNGHRGRFGDAEVGQSGSNFIHSEGFKLFVEKWETPSAACEDVNDIPSRVKNLKNGGSHVSSITHNATMPFDWV